MKSRILSVAMSGAAALGSMPTWAATDGYAEISMFVEKVCQNPVGGKYVRTEIDGSIRADAPGLAKALGLTLGADGRLYRDSVEYEGIPMDRLSKEIQTPGQCKFELVKLLLEERKLLAKGKAISYKSCRHPDFGQAGWNRTEDYTGSSGWRDGGSNPINWCNDLAAKFLRERQIGSAHQVSFHNPREESNKDWKGHVTYNYHCTVRAAWDPLYHERNDARCGVVTN